VKGPLIITAGPLQVTQTRIQTDIKVRIYRTLRTTVQDTEAVPAIPHSQRVRPGQPYQRHPTREAIQHRRGKVLKVVQAIPVQGHHLHQVQHILVPHPDPAADHPIADHLQAADTPVAAHQAVVAAEEDLAAAVEAAPEGNHYYKNYLLTFIIPTVNGRDWFIKNENYEKVNIGSGFSLRDSNRSLFTEC
jgi:hypothetical protein